MTDAPTHLERADLLDVARAAFEGRELVAVERLRGGTKKGVYRLFLDDGATSIAEQLHGVSRIQGSRSQVVEVQRIPRVFLGFRQIEAAGGELQEEGVEILPGGAKIWRWQPVTGGRHAFDSRATLSRD
ncbi:hypothetical protein [Saccharopolyspora phatthalungensis]|uniref:Uncharacterized protein n=1 Tax=Saccharopolyspora phatthalungensis TaxID=664693 RepID=A0A840Q312_9PSEU|nr:hypothetical protein [Saccharopolyspora phatthalungensis]